MSRPILAQINLPALAANLSVARGRAPGAQVLAVVKANAYGHGILRVLPALGDADGLALLELDAAITLREHHYARRILLLEGFFCEDELQEISARRLAVVVHQQAQVDMLVQSTLSRPIEVFVKINSGMNRLGFRPQAVRAVTTTLAASANVVALRLMTHLSRAEEETGISEALASFESACQGLPYPRSIANSAGVIRFEQVGGDYVRPGIMLYGASPFPFDTAAMLGLKPVMTLRSEIIAINEIDANESVGYGGGYIASRAHRIGVISCGYADGYPRHAPNGTPVLVHGHKVPIAGRVSMDMITVDLSNAPEAVIGSPAIMWGNGLPVDDVAAAAGTVGYELLCALAPRVPTVTTQVAEVDIEL